MLLPSTPHQRVEIMKEVIFELIELYPRKVFLVSNSPDFFFF